MRRKCYLKTIRTCPHRLRFVKSKIKNIQADENLFFKDTYDVDLILISNQKVYKKFVQKLAYMCFCTDFLSTL